MNLCGFKDALEKKHNASIHFIIKPTHEIVILLTILRIKIRETSNKQRVIEGFI